MRRELTAKKAVRTGSVILLVVVIIGYGIWISRDLLFGITMRVSGIEDGTSVTAPILELSGVARHANAVTLDGRPVAMNEHGDWADAIALLPGYNVVTVAATDKFGRTIAHSYRVYYAVQ